MVKYHLSFYSQPLIVCRYFIYGMQDSQNLERVVLAFDKFDIPYGRMDRFQQLEQSSFIRISTLPLTVGS